MSKQQEIDELIIKLAELVASGGKYEIDYAIGALEAAVDELRTARRREHANG